ncbi:MAG: peptidylprolyl isomerase [Anaerolineales bacterium]|nr:peptidylprolyl isomerase [Anaerolineales bacterium]
MTDKKHQIIAKDMVVSMSYTLRTDGEWADATDEGESLTFIQGHGNIIPGLEKAMEGLTAGETRAIRVFAKDAYGEYELEQIVPIPMSEFPDDFDLEPGLELEMEDQDGDIIYARIFSVGKSRVKMDFNHPLAGKDLDFEIAILDVRPATPEELAQGFVSQVPDDQN